MAISPVINKAAIIGVGLLGASFSLALKEMNLCRTISGFGRSEKNLNRAKERGIIDDYSLEAADACKDADFVLLSTPVGAFSSLVNTIRGDLKKGAVITDVGSVKGRLVYDLESYLPEGVSYIGAHPIAGSDKSGIDDARPNLFNGARCIITPTENSDQDALNKVESIWTVIGAKVELMNPYKHDEIYAVVSHLPHIIAYALVNTVGDIDYKYIDYSGQGFKDSTRIALSSPEMWRDISIFNRDNLMKLLGSLKENLQEIERLLQTGDASGLENIFLRAQELRKRLK